MDTLEMMKRHLGKPTEIELDNPDKTTDKFKISPLTPEQLPELYETMKILKGASAEDATAIFDNISKEVLDKVVNLGTLALKPNYPDIDENILKELVARNAIVFLMKLWEANLSMTSEVGEIKRAKTIQRLREKRNASS